MSACTITAVVGKIRQQMLQLARCFLNLFLINAVLSCILSLTYVFCVQDTFRGRVCECPVVNGVQFKGDGYRSCSGMSRILICSVVYRIVRDGLKLSHTLEHCFFDILIATSV